MKDNGNVFSIVSRHVHGRCCREAVLKQKIVLPKGTAKATIYGINNYALVVESIGPTVACITIKHIEKRHIIITASRISTVA
jgi:hypothetical protein